MIADIARRFVLALIRVYQVLFSPLFAGSCRFVPSCSNYATEAVERFGAVRGSALAVRRLLRCHPFGGHGLDPVPAFAPSEPRPASAPSGLRRDRPEPAESCKTNF